VSTRPPAHPTEPSGPAHSPQEGESPWWAHAPEDALRRLDSSAAGLTSADAAERLERYGPNTIRAEDVEPWWTLVGRQFRDPLIYILLVAAAVTLALRHNIDAGVILAVVVLNAVIGFVQEYRARQAMLALAQLGAPKADVIRDGETRHLSAEELVPGDVVLLTSGARVPADLRLLRAVDLEVDESMLTGESVPVRKQPEAVVEGAPVAGDQVNMAFGATMVTRGRARGLVVRTGPATEVGRIAEAMHEVGRVQTPLQRKVHDFGGKVGIAILAMAVVTGVLGFLRGLGWAELFMTAVALAVASIPEGLPVVLTVTLAVGVRRMAGRKAIIRRLPAVETLGSTTVIASDKTGTLTRNEMTVRAVWTVNGRYAVSGVGYGRDGAVNRGDRAGGSEGVGQLPPPEHAALRETLLAGVLASEADARMVDEGGSPLGDPTEVALLVAASKAGEDPSDVRLRYPEMGILPFEPELQYMATLVTVDEGARIYMKGAPEAVLARADRVLGPDGVGPLDLDTRERILEGAHALAGEGLRVLAMAYKDTNADKVDVEATAGGFVFCGLQGMEDPVRPEAVDAVAAVQGAGIRVLMLTGDHLATARAIGAQLGFDDTDRRAVEGSELGNMTDDDLDACLDAGVQVFARVAPEHKLRIVQRLRAQGEVVAVTGDGVNDAPALRAAHLGIAMGARARTWPAKLRTWSSQDDNFATITCRRRGGAGRLLATCGR
jgi:magnesium-transporting ATPase (P-type)